MTAPTFQEFVGLYDSLKAKAEEDEILDFEFSRLELHPQTQPVSTGNSLSHPQYVNQQLASR